MPKFVLVIRSWATETGGLNYTSIRFWKRESAEEAKRKIREQDQEAYCFIIED